ncbi:AEC family transporter [Sulfuricystis multivorans]|uniref:AEC family transporter n=1 Tax=Sulfuricystis multivorans TaxID=2211108 RepID=UPI000F833B72|nr:AEC family transporter [Sulfuricystis multivorans]
MFFRILSIIFPIFAIIGAGWLYARLRHRNGGGIDMAFANQLNMEVFVPALVFAALVSKDFALGSYRDLALAALLLMFGSGIVAWWLARLLGEQPKTFVPPMMFVNSGNMGLPLMVLAFGDGALPAAVVLFFVENLLHYTLGTWLLDHHARLWNLWRVPVIFAALLALAVKFVEVPLWPPLLVAIKLVGDVAIPLLLFSLGVRLALSQWSDVRLGLIGMVLRPATGMLFAALLARLLALDERDAAMLMVFGALPPAVLNYVFAERYHQEPAKVASLVMIGNLGALLFIPLALAMTLQ